MTEAQKRVTAKLTEFVAPGGVGVDYPLSPEVQQEWISVTRAECFELLGLIDRLKVKAEGGRPPKPLIYKPTGEVVELKVEDGVLVLPQVTPRDAELVREAIANYPNAGHPVKPPFDGTYPTGQEKRAGAREQPPPNSGDQPQ